MGAELILRPLPGPAGSYTFRSTRTRRLFTCCARCLAELGRAGAIDWEANRPTD